VPAGEAPGGWVRAGSGVPVDAVRGYSLADLLWGLDDELWELELDDVRGLERHAVHGRRGRLLRRVNEWTPSLAADLVEACAWRVRDAAVSALNAGGREREAEALALVADLPTLEESANRAAVAKGDGARLAGFAADVVLYARDAESPAAAAAVAAYIAAHALAGGDKDVRTYDAKFETERGWQAGWLRERLRL
jgi:hypothetical protein